jgi:predicted nucleic acid-binding protein
MVLEAMDIKKLRVYLETTVFNYYFDEDRDGHSETVSLFKAIADGYYEAYTSSYAFIELKGALEPKQSNMLELIDKYGILMLLADDESYRLANKYISEGVLSENHRMDCSHIAIASTNGLDCVLSFNFKHINKLRTKELATFINLKEGYKGITICTPMEVLDDEITEHD